MMQNIYSIPDDFRQVARLEFEAGTARVAAVWSLNGYGRITQAAVDAARAFEGVTGIKAAFAYVRKLPASVEEGTEFNGVMFFSADYVPERFVVVCGWHSVDHKE